MEEEGVWKELYRNVSPPELRNTVVGFNINLDRIIPVTRDVWECPDFLRPGFSELRSRLARSMRLCTAEEWFVADQSLYGSFAAAFADTGSLLIGGQAGIAAAHLASIGVPKVICAAPGAGPETARLLSGTGVRLLTFRNPEQPVADTVHLVFEYLPGSIFPAECAIPRGNRFIASPVHAAETVLVPKGAMDTFMEDISTCTRAFFSGYQYLDKKHFTPAARQLERIKKGNTDMRIHIELVSASDPEVLDGLTQKILPHADSIGLNERELSFLSASLGTPGTELTGSRMVQPAELIGSAIGICKITKIPRLHLHTFGFYALLVRKSLAHPSDSQNALLYASLLAAGAAKGSGTALSRAGITALGQISEMYKSGGQTGVFSCGDYVLVAIPAFIAENPQRTCGLGDILSSTAFVADRF
jgi:ADP-dependent phosphofructokinase/glucokinase